MKVAKRLIVRYSGFEDLVGLHAQDCLVAGVLLYVHVFRGHVDIWGVDVGRLLLVEGSRLIVCLYVLLVLLSGHLAAHHADFKRQNRRVILGFIEL